MSWCVPLVTLDNILLMLPWLNAASVFTFLCSENQVSSKVYAYSRAFNQVDGAVTGHLKSSTQKARKAASSCPFAIEQVLIGLRNGLAQW